MKIGSGGGMGGFKNRDVECSEHRNPTTLGDLAAENIGVFCWCNRCNHNAEVATSSLIGSLGPLFSVPKLGSLMRCSACNARDVATRPAWPSHGGGAIARHD
ncbi:MAG: hypothetical protein VW307_03245 [Alphaproteobacteria bacterium]